MKQPEISKLQPEAYFELEDFMNFSKESRMDSATLEALTTWWEKWLGLLEARQITDENASWLVVWLPESVAREVDAAWQNLPSKSFMMNSLAQYLCMNAVGNFLPQMEELGCAPTPSPHQVLRNGLQQLGLAAADGTLSNRYAVVTHYPFRGGCEVCNLSENCPRQSASDAFSGIVLPGYEI